MLGAKSCEAYAEGHVTLTSQHAVGPQGIFPQPRPLLPSRRSISLALGDSLAARRARNFGRRIDAVLHLHRRSVRASFFGKQLLTAWATDGNGEHRRHKRIAAEPLRRHQRQPPDPGGHQGQDLRRHQWEVVLRARRLLRHVLREGCEQGPGQDVHQVGGCGG